MQFKRVSGEGMRQICRQVVLIACVFGAGLAGLVEAGAQDTKQPAVLAARLSEVRVPGTTPMAAAGVDLSRWGYTEREFYAEGVANRYRDAVLGRLQTAEIIDGNWRYRTRVLVRAPKAEKFNGTLVVEWANVTTGQDIDFAFAESYDFLMREGYAVAVVSAQRVGVDRLRTWNPERYGVLDVAVGNDDPKDGSKIDTCGSTLACPGDALSWDIMTQISKALKDNPVEPNPLPGMRVEKVIALGESQSAFRLSVYYNTIQPIYRFFDGFAFLDLATQLRSDLATPAISVNSESTASMFPATTTSKNTRIWAVAGASHSSLYAAQYVDAVVLRDKSLPGPSGAISFSQILAAQNCTLSPLFSTVNSGLVLNAALAALDAWIRTGKPAAATKAFERDTNRAIVRDAGGNISGGIRLAQYSVPTAAIAINGPTQFCTLAGHHRDFTPEELKARYGTHDGYVVRVRQAMLQPENDGYILPFDRDAVIRDAEESNIAE